MRLVLDDVDPDVAALLHRIVRHQRDKRLIQIHENLQGVADYVRQIEIGLVEVKFDKHRVRAVGVQKSHAPHRRS